MKISYHYVRPSACHLATLKRRGRVCRCCPLPWEGEHGLHFFHCCVEKLKDPNRKLVNSNYYCWQPLCFSFYVKMLLVTPADYERREKAIKISLLSENCPQKTAINLSSFNHQLNWFDKMVPPQIHQSSSFCFSDPFEINHRGTQCRWKSVSSEIIYAMHIMFFIIKKHYNIFIF